MKIQHEDFYYACAYATLQRFVISISKLLDATDRPTNQPTMSLHLGRPFDGFKGWTPTNVITVDADCAVTNCSRWPRTGGVVQEINTISFSLEVGDDCHIRSFLTSIKPNSEVSFNIMAYRDDKPVREIGWVIHELYGLIDQKKYLLHRYVGPDDHDSPVWS